MDWSSASQLSVPADAPVTAFFRRLSGSTDCLKSGLNQLDRLL